MNLLILILIVGLSFESSLGNLIEVVVDYQKLIENLLIKQEDQHCDMN